MIATAPRAHELERTPDLVELVAAARDAGHEAALLERPMPDAVSVAGVGRLYDLVSTPGGAAVEDADGHRLDEEEHPDRLIAAARLWSRLSERLDGATHPGPPGTGLVALGGFAFDPSAEPAGPWAGFPALLFRVPALAVTRVRGRTFTSGDPSLLELPPGHRAPAARSLDLRSPRPDADWLDAVAEAGRRLRSGEAEKVVLAREVIARADGVLAAAAVTRALRAAYPACFVYLVTGADGTAFAGASPELLARRSGATATSRPMAGSAPRGHDDDDDERLAAALLGSVKDLEEHRVTVRHVTHALGTVSERVDAGRTEIARLTNIQHLATTVRASLRRPAAGLLELASVLHPTPAINGAPPERARRLIAELERMERGWYAGAVGWMDGREDGELAVAIRCGLLWEDGARLYAGVGVMPGSDPACELRETELKLRALLTALAG